MKSRAYVWVVERLLDDAWQPFRAYPARWQARNVARADGMARVRKAVFVAVPGRGARAAREGRRGGGV